MTKRSAISAVFAALLLTGCASQPNVAIGPTPTCTGAEACKAKWDAAQLFVVKNAGRKIQVATDVIIETFNPSQYGTEIAMRVTKEPLGNGNYKLVAVAWCDNVFGCARNPRQIVADFNTYVSGITP